MMLNNIDMHELNTQIDACAMSIRGMFTATRKQDDRFWLALCVSTFPTNIADSHDLNNDFRADAHLTDARANVTTLPVFSNRGPDSADYPNGNVSLGGQPRVQAAAIQTQQGGAMNVGPRNEEVNSTVLITQLNTKNDVPRPRKPKGCS